MNIVSVDTEFKRILNFANAALLDVYPQAPTINQDKTLVLSDSEFVQTVEESTTAGFHPVYRAIIEERARQQGQEIRYVLPQTESWFNPDTGNYFLTGHSLEDLKMDKKKGYLGIGLNLCHFALSLPVRAGFMKSEETDRYVAGMISRMNEEVEVLEPEDKARLLSLAQERGVSLFLRGAVNRIVVENLFVGPQYGSVAEEAVLLYLSRPIKERYMDIAAGELRLPLVERAAIKSRVGFFGAALIPYRDAGRYVKHIIDSLENLGFRGAKAVADGYQSSEIAKRIVLRHR